MFKVEYFSVDATTTPPLILSGTPADSSSVAVDIIGGTAQALGVNLDFIVTDRTVTWGSDMTGFDLNIDTIRVVYDQI